VGGFVINGINENGYSGNKVSGAGDVNGDGLDDLIIGAFKADAGVFNSDVGETYVVFGKTGGTAVELSAISNDNNLGGFVIKGIAGVYESGISVSGAGDVNGDGLDDVIIGADLAHVGENTEAGRSFVVFGKTDGAAVELSAIEFAPTAPTMTSSMPSPFTSPAPETLKPD